VLHQYENDDEPVRPILDHELSNAIGSLQNSTAAIEEQCKVLEAQRDALVALKALDKPNLSVEHMRNERRRKENQEKARLDTAVEDISISISEQLGDAQRDIKAEKSILKSYLTERLASDDQILSKVPGIVSQIVSEPETNEDETSIDQWCQAIISFRTAEVKAKVDVAYLTSLANSLPDDLPMASEEELDKRKSDLKAELETLHSEIASVAEMVVEHELRKPMTDIKERKDRERTQARSAWLNYVRLSHLTRHGNSTVLIVAGLVNARVHGQAPRYRHISYAKRGRLPTSLRACQRSCTTTNTRLQCRSPNTSEKSCDIRSQLEHLRWGEAKVHKGA
jgi:chromosome segregation ATPase